MIIAFGRIFHNRHLCLPRQSLLLLMQILTLGSDVPGFNWCNIFSNCLTYSSLFEIEAIFAVDNNFCCKNWAICLSVVFRNGGSWLNHVCNFPVGLMIYQRNPTIWCTLAWSRLAVDFLHVYKVQISTDIHMLKRIWRNNTVRLEHRYLMVKIAIWSIHIRQQHSLEKFAGLVHRCSTIGWTRLGSHICWLVWNRIAMSVYCLCFEMKIFGAKLICSPNSCKSGDSMVGKTVWGH